MESRPVPASMDTVPVGERLPGGLAVVLAAAPGASVTQGRCAVKKLAILASVVTSF